MTSWPGKSWQQLLRSECRETYRYGQHNDWMNFHRSLHHIYLTVLDDRSNAGMMTRSDNAAPLYASVT
jgi:hypothetical protein